LRTHVADEQILAGAAATLTASFRDQDGDLADPAGTVTVGIVNANGSTVVAAGTATTNAGTGLRTVALPAASNLVPQLLTCSWTNGTVTLTTTVEVVGGYYASTKQVRDSDDVLADTRKYPAATLVAARRSVEVEFEDYCRAAFVPRYRRVRLDGSGDTEQLLPDPYVRAVRSVRIYDTDGNYTAFTAPELAAIEVNDSGIIYRTDGDTFDRGEQNVVVEYEHGLDQPPADLADAFMMRLRDVVNRAHRGVPDRASTFTSDVGGTYSLLVAGRGGSITGIPDVDVALRRHSRRIPGIA
jgi:hypothetical protein